MMASRRAQDPSVAVGASYEQWIDYLQRFAKAEPGLGMIIEPFPESVGQRSVMRLAGHAVDAVSARLELWSKGVKREMSMAKTPRDVERSLVKSRSDLAVVWRFVRESPLPESVLTSLNQMVRESIEQTQKAMEEQVERTGNVELLQAVRRADLRAVIRGDVEARSLPRPTQPPPSSAATGRKVLIARRVDGEDDQ